MGAKDRLELKASSGVSVAAAQYFVSGLRAFLRRYAARSYLARNIVGLRIVRKLEGQ